MTNYTMAYCSNGHQFTMHGSEMECPECSRVARQRAADTLELRQAVLGALREFLPELIAELKQPEQSAKPSIMDIESDVAD